MRLECENGPGRPHDYPLPTRTSPMAAKQTLFGPAPKAPPRQFDLELHTEQTAGEVLARIRRESRDKTEKGRWFEQLVMHVVQQEPEFEIEGVWRWADWPDRKPLTGLDARDIGVDLVARRTTGE